MYRFVFFMNKGPSGRGEKEEYAEAEVVAQHVAEQADSDAENNDFLVVEEGGNERHKWRGVDERDGGDKGGVAVEA